MNFPSEMVGLEGSQEGWKPDARGQSVFQMKEVADYHVSIVFTNTYFKKDLATPMSKISYFQIFFLV